MEQDRHKFLKKFVIIIIFSVFVMCLYNAFLFLNSQDESSNGKIKAYVIETNSMEPNYNIGDFILVKQCNKFTDIKTEDVITFKEKGQYITHRVINIDEAQMTFTTKGDKNKVADYEAIKFNDVIGKVIFKIPYFGKILFLFKKGIYVLVLIIIITTLYLREKRLSRLRSIRRAKKKNEDRRLKNNEENNKESN